MMDRLHAPDPVAMSREDADGLIAAVHGYCEKHCPLRDHCPGMRCKLYRREQAARDVLVKSADLPKWEDPAP